MDKGLEFRFDLPKVPDGPVVALSPEQAEKLLLQKLAEAKADPRTALWELAQFYKISRQHDKALERLRELIRLLPDPEAKANCVFTMGQAMEQVGDYAAALSITRKLSSWNRRARSPGISSTTTWAIA